MARIESLRGLLVEELRDLYDAERQLTQAIPKLVDASTNDGLKQGLSSHLRETKEQVARLEQAFELLDEPAAGKSCAGMEGLIEEGDEDAKEDYTDDAIRDAAIIAAAQRVEHYEIAAYGTAIVHANLLDMEDVCSLLEQSLGEEQAADRKLTEIAQNVVNSQTVQDNEAASEDEDVSVG